MRFVSVSFLFLVDDFDLSVSTATRKRADQPIRPSACAKTVPREAHCAARGSLRQWDFGRTTFGQSVEGQLAAVQSRSQYLFEPKQYLVSAAIPYAAVAASLCEAPACWNCILLASPTGRRLQRRKIWREPGASARKSKCRVTNPESFRGSQLSRWFLNPKEK